jgi:hypothetical protein
VDAVPSDYAEDDVIPSSEGLIRGQTVHFTLQSGAG